MEMKDEIKLKELENEKKRLDNQKELIELVKEFIKGTLHNIVYIENYGIQV